MKCKNCSAPLPANAIFCAQCGKPVFDYRETVERAQRGDQDAFSQLYDRTASIVYRAVSPMVRDEDTAQDILQDTYLKVFDKIGTLNDPAAFPGWVKQIGVRMALDILRKKKQLPTSRFSEMENDEGYMPEIVDDRTENLPQLKMDREENRRLIREILDTLTDEQRTVITLYYYHDKSIREISEMIGGSEGTVKSRLHYGRGKVQKAVLEQEKRGVKLYSLTPLLFLAALFRNGDTLELSGQEKALLQRTGQNVIQTAVSRSAETLSRGSGGGHSDSKAVESRQISHCPGCGSVITVPQATFCIKCGSRLNNSSGNGAAAKTQPRGGDVGNPKTPPGNLAGSAAIAGDAAAHAGTAAGIGLHMKMIIAAVVAVILIAGAAIAVIVARDARGMDSAADATSLASSQQSETDDDIIIESVSEPSQPDDIVIESIADPAQADDIVIESVTDPGQSNGAQSGTSTGTDDIVVSNMQGTTPGSETPADSPNATGGSIPAATTDWTALAPQITLGGTASKSVTYSCVYFGSYPQAEVVSSEAMMTSIISDAILEADDYLVDAALYARLQSETGWNDDEISIDGEKYRRARESDAYIGEGVGTPNYTWSEGTYHYFKYEPIRWRVLGIDGSTALLLADRCLDSKPYNASDTPGYVGWADCTLRSWLNGYGAADNTVGIDYSGLGFIDYSFNSTEKEAIIRATVLNNLSNEDADGTGVSTEDPLFLLSIEEITNTEYGFTDGQENIGYGCYGPDKARCAYGTTFAMAMGSYWIAYDVYTESEQYGPIYRHGKVCYFLRSSGNRGEYITFLIDTDGSYGYEAQRPEYVYYDDSGFGVRPALRLDLNSACWSDAGTVCTDEF